ncbi:MAG: winged helix-turn-helix domain-containing protein [Acidobacteriota bacterium]
MHEPNENDVYEFDGLRVDVTRRKLLRDGVPVQLTAKSFDTLLFLIRNHGSTVTKAELMNAIWPDASVEENNLTQQISALRKVLGERPNDHRFIVTVPGRGYCFVAELNEGTFGVETPQPADGKRFDAFAGHFDAAALRGYSLAIAQIVLIAFAFLWSAMSDQGLGRPQSLAVLNFKVANGDEFIGNGISETLRARLGSVEDLTVRPAPPDPDALDVGRRMKVDTVVTGSVQRDHDRIRVAVELLDVSNGTIIWGKTFDDTASNIFALQDAIAGEVARVLNVRFSSRSNAVFARGYVAISHALEVPVWRRTSELLSI